ncbi:GreA/GreB family elongation factor [Patescibacteria group bacterium]|nr:GreA/GreB family elongation factor [Patescibacteria group bacterium]
MLNDKEYHLTEKGLVRLKAEYQHLIRLRSAKTKGEFPQVWHSEDLNPEYLSFQEDLSLLEIRLAELEAILKNVKLIRIPSKARQDIIHLGAKVLVEVDGQADEFIIVGSLEANPATGEISNESPVGKALLGHKIGEEIVISSPIKVLYKVKRIRYLS